ncbi:hypothetical protein, partial [Marinagarivorans algicola]|uniref:hypothetical protein n=1 Tax=Marinagarivorans algicola TaxID=1513270 RepID=UPI000AD61C86
QADPYIDGAGSVGGYNRYSYLKNNPLNGTDPTGYLSLKKVWNKVRPFVGVIVGAAVAFFCQLCGAGIMKAAIVGASAGAAGAAANGGNVLQAAVIGFISGAAFGAIGEYFNGAGAANATLTKSRAFFTKFGGNLLTKGQIVAQVSLHAAAGGISAVLQGGKFGHGFASAGFTKGVMGGAGFDYSNTETSAIFGRTAIAAIVGGTTSAATGGKFENGAKTAALAHLLNAESKGLAQKGEIRAARKALRKALKMTKDNEIGGAIYKHKGKYGYSLAPEGVGRGVYPQDAVIPDGAESVAFFHTHPDVGDVNFSDEMLYGSQLDMSTGKMEMVEMGRAGDKPLARQYGVRIYLGVRPRVFKVFDPNREGAGDGVTDLGRL